MDEIKIKTIIRKKYADSVNSGGGCCSLVTQDENLCCCKQSDDLTQSDDDVIIESADLGLSCGLPVQDAGIKTGNHVLDLGCGAGIDVFRAAKVVGETGFVIGVDMTAEMVAQARKNAVRGGYQNTQFKLGEIEDLPIPDSSQDVVISNCVINLVLDKELAFKEIYRTLKPGGHFCVSDIVLNEALPDFIKQDVYAWAECISGAIQKQSYLDLINDVGFKDVEIVQSHESNIASYEFEGLESITVIGYKR